MILERILMILEVSRKQEYIFASTKLRENAERSGDIAYVTDSAFFRAAAGELYREDENLVYSGGGHTVLQFDGREQAAAFAKKVTETVLREFQGLELFVKQMPYDSGKTPGDNLKELSAELEKKKSLRKSSFRQLSFGVEALDGESFAPVLCGEEQVRRFSRTSRLSPPAGWEFPSEFEKLAGKDNFIAVIHIDGNAMGKRVDDVYKKYDRDWESCRSGLRRFSEGIQRDFEQAFTEMADEAALQCPDLKPDLPVRPVILAGDDVCFVTAGNIGLECARVFLEKLTAKCNQEGGDGDPYAACAGVALVHKKFPFHRAYDLAEELCSGAKNFGATLDPCGQGRVSAMDWHIEFGQLKESLSALREDYTIAAQEDDKSREAPEELRLELRPVAVIVPQGCGNADVRSYEFFKALCLAVKGESGKIARSKIKDLRQAFKQGELESEFFLHDKQVNDLLYHGINAQFPSEETRQAFYREVLVSGNAEMKKELFRDTGDKKRRCLFFDAIEMMDHFTAFKEVDV